MGLAVAVLAGCIGGLASRAFFPGSSSPTQLPSNAPEANVSSKASTPGGMITEGIRAQTLLVPTPPIASIAAPEMQPAEPFIQETPREASMREFALHSQLLEKHNSEPRNPAWSRPMEQRLNAFLAAVNVPGVHVLATDCRSATCSATIRVDAGAGASLGSMVHGGTPFPCSRRISVPPGVGPESFDAEMFIDCRDSLGNLVSPDTDSIASRSRESEQ